jgi:hypothetical protein
MGTRLAKLVLTAMTSGVLAALAFSVATAQQASALSGSEFQAGRIIDDSIFYNPNTMTIQQIQQFLEAKVPVCDTWGTQMRGSITRAQHGTNNGNPPPYTCLRDFRQDTVAKPYEAGLCNGYGVANHSAADIIYTVAQSCGINPKVLLVLLQKEQSLITDDWPWNAQYRSATGYGCPDTAPCDAQYYGFFNQVYAAARGFKYYAKNPNSFNYLAGRNNFIQYNPNSGCSGTTVFIQNQATAGLYNYTPYQPNAAALNNLYGTGDGCSAYGNRNFWRMFNDWFGSTSDNIPIHYGVRLTTPITMNPANPVAGEPVTVTYTVKNFDPNNPIAFDSSILQCRLLPYTSCDPAHNAPFTLAANASHTFTTTLTTMQTGGNYALVPYFRNNGVWYRFGTDIANGNMVNINIPGMRLITPITTTPAEPAAGEPLTVSYSVQNMGVTTAYYDSAIAQCRLNVSTSCDPVFHTPIAIPPNEIRTFVVTIPSIQGGDYTITPHFQTNGIWYKYGLWGQSSNKLDFSVKDVRLISNINISPADPIPGQALTASYTVRNESTQPVTFDTSILQCRINTWTVCDPSLDAPMTLASNAQHTFTYNLPTAKAGTYNLVPYFRVDGKWHRYGRGGVSTSSVSKLVVPPYVAHMRLTSPITFSPANPIPGQPVTATYTVRNTSDKPAIIQTSILQCRRDTWGVCDPSADAPYTVAPGAEHTYTVNIAAVKAGTHVFTPYYMQNDHWYMYEPGTIGYNSIKLHVPTYVADMRLTGPITISPANPIADDTVTVSYTAKNFGSQPGIFQNSIIQCRRNVWFVCDPAYDGAYTVAAGAERTFTRTFTAGHGNHVFIPYFMQNDTWYRYGQGAAPANYIQFSAP